tara:strand:+ start:2780 stop:3928 length:1149 start_codon:yes stop_codon:yes gene_type:complete
MEEEWKRELGDGKWDKILKRKMVELSVADDYNVAKHEWVATGNVWWHGCGEAMPDWVRIHPNKCLCSHNIVYHFEIHNTENGVRECVGSDHINSYLIIRAIEEEHNISRDMITEEMIEEWVNVNVATMKKNAWWNNNGENFEMMFNKIKDLDLRVNVRTLGREFSYKYKTYVPKTKIRKTSSGLYGTFNYKMGSIVWRWNHPDNPKAQIHTRGYPTEKLMNDLSLFYAFYEKYKADVDKQDADLNERLEKIKLANEENAKRQAEIEVNRTMAAKIQSDVEDSEFIEYCNYYAIRPFSENDGTNDWERNFLSSVRTWIVSGKEPTEAQLSTLSKILDSERDAEMATEKQCAFLLKLGYEGEIAHLTKRQASREISDLLKQREE